MVGKGQKVEYLVFSVGAIRGLAFIDAYDELRQQADVQLRGLAGSSAGALMCLAIALDLTRDEMLAFFAGDWFRNTPWRLSTRSLIDTGPLLAAMRTMFSRKGVDERVDFAHFAPSLDVRVVACNLTQQRRHVFSRATTPNISVLEGVLASCAMPIFMPVVCIDNDLFADGFLADGFPMSEFPAATTLGFFLNDFLRPARREDNVICIDVSRLFFLQFNPSPELRDWVLRQGREAVQRYFQR
jgi:predicted acylesterase/phospholipase RssA